MTDTLLRLNPALPGRRSTADLWTKRADGSAQAVIELDQQLPPG